MEFKYPLLLLALLAIPLLILYYWRITRRSKYAIRYSSLSLIKEAVGKSRKRRIQTILFFLSVVASLLAISRPSLKFYMPFKRGILVLAIDMSGSMMQDDLKPFRYEAAKQASIQLVENQDQRLTIAVVAFAGTANVVQSPTTNHEEIVKSINRLLPEGGTAIGDAVALSLELIKKEVPPGIDFLAPAAIILLTDGENNVGSSPAEMAEKVATYGARMYTIGVGDKKSYDEELLKRMATMTHGEYYRAKDTESLKEIYSKFDFGEILKSQTIEATFLLSGIAAASMITFFLIGHV